MSSTPPNAIPHDLQAILFDFDGTLADSYQAIAASVNHVRASHQMEPLPEDEIRRHVGEGPGHLLGITVGTGDPEKNTALYRAHHPGIMRELTFLLPGAKEALTAVRQLGLKSAICSNKIRGYTHDLLEYLQIDSLVDEVLGPQDVARSKPAPDMLLKAVERLGVEKEQALYVGDMTVDIDAARSAGIRAWIVPTGSQTREILEKANPDRLLDSIADLPTILQEARS